MVGRFESGFKQQRWAGQNSKAVNAERRRNERGRKGVASGAHHEVEERDDGEHGLQHGLHEQPVREHGVAHGEAHGAHVRRPCSGGGR